MSHQSTSRFSDPVASYVRYRPGYPPEILPYLENAIGLHPGMTIADIGSGTGLLTGLFLQNGYTVYAVEPNNSMRAAAENTFQKDPAFISIPGTAEQTGLENDLADLITAAQAFHWFDPLKTKAEFQRIARGGAHVALIWNERLTTSPFGKAYEMLLRNFASDYTQVDHRNITEEKIAAFFHPFSFQIRIFDNEQVFDLPGLKGRILSSSYMPNQGHPGHEEMITALKNLYDLYAQSGRVKMEYATKVYLGKIK